MGDVELTAAVQERESGRSFERVLVGVDGTDSSFEACRQAVRLAAPAALLEAVAVAHLADAAKAGPTAPRLAEELEIEAKDALRRARAILGEETRTRFVDGVPTRVLLREAGELGADLIALGSHGHTRVAELLFGGALGEVLHRAPCTVLIARAAVDGAEVPRGIVAGDDGSKPAAIAVATARNLAERLGVPLRVVTARNRPPVDALADACGDADLLVVGHRGVHGLRALGSVSERLAHRAHCSVLVVHA